MGGIGSDELGVFYERFAPAVHRRALRMLGREADAWDAVQEVFRSVMESGAAFRGEARPMTYFYRVTTNVCLNLLRSRRVREPTAPAGEEPSGSIDDAAEARQILRRLADILDGRALQVASLHYLDGLTQEEIGDVLDLSRKTIGRELDSIRAAAERAVGVAHV